MLGKGVGVRRRIFSVTSPPQTISIHIGACFGLIVKLMENTTLNSVGTRKKIVGGRPPAIE